ncbi:MAG: zinc-ribbon domain-containing protein [Lachnospiraceae bacterium]|nr:zinc-ribbon domain-containing protein [Lachnospiraceae bacterium]
MFCGKCGNQMKEGDQFCGKCGTKNTNLEEVQEPVKMQPAGEVKPVGEVKPAQNPKSI